MRTLQEKYNAVLEGNFSKTQFRRDAAIEMPQFVSTINSFNDTVDILKNKGAITEAEKQEPKYSTAKPVDTIAPDVLDTGIKFELDKKYGTLDVTPEQYDKCRETAIKNLSKDVLYYVKQDSVQLDEPGEKMEKAKLNEVKVKVSIPGQDDFDAEEGKEYSEEEAEEYVKNAKASGATPMNTKFRIEEETDEAIQNIENDEYTIKRIAKLVNQVLQDADPRDETIKAYAISVKNDLESGDTSRLKRYKDIISLDDLKDDVEHYISHDVDQLEEIDRNDPISMRLRANKMKREKEAAKPKRRPLYGKQRQKVEDEIIDIDQELKDLYSDKNQTLIDMEQEAEPEGGPEADRYGTMLDKIDKAIAQLQGTKKEKEYKLMEEEGDVIKLSPGEMERLYKQGKITLPNGSELHFTGFETDESVNEENISLVDWNERGFEKGSFAAYTHGSLIAKLQNRPDKLAFKKGFVQGVIDQLEANINEENLSEPDAEDLYQHDDEYLATLEQRKSLKEMFKKIITKVIND